MIQPIYGMFLLTYQCNLLSICCVPDAVLHCCKGLSLALHYSHFTQILEAQSSQVLKLGKLSSKPTLFSSHCTILLTLLSSQKRKVNYTFYFSCPILEAQLREGENGKPCWFQLRHIKDLEVIISVLKTRKSEKPGHQEVNEHSQTHRSSEVAKQVAETGESGESQQRSAYLELFWIHKMVETLKW